MQLTCLLLHLALLDLFYIIYTRHVGVFLSNARNPRFQMETLTRYWAEKSKNMSWSHVILLLVIKLTMAIDNTGQIFGIKNLYSLQTTIYFPSITKMPRIWRKKIGDTG